ncbi:MAG: hypothetical protein OHK0039_19550 [Bacteroidia bacterium]
MQKLSNDWFMEGMLDFEYKKYVLLAYLQHVSREFAEVRLYPSFDELIHHYNNLQRFREEKRKLYEQFPTRMNEEEFRRMKLVQQPEVEDGQDMQEIETIVDYSLPMVQRHLLDGKEIYDYIDQQLAIEPIGVLPLYKREGYLMLRIEPLRDVKVFAYKVVLLENTGVNYHGISMQFIDTYALSLAQSYESIKRELIRRRSELPNPATYLLYTPRPFPEEEALLPVAKRKMLSYLK